MAINTPANQEIMDALKRQSDLGLTIKQRYTDQPAVTANTRAVVFGQDKPLGDLMGGFSDKVAELYKYDQARSSVYNEPFKTEAGVEMPINPMIGERATQGYFDKAVQDKENAWKLYEIRKNILGDVMDLAVKKYEAETKGMIAEADIIEKEINTKMSVWKETNRIAESARDYALEEKKLKGSGVFGTAEDIKTGLIDPNDLSDEDAVAMVQDIYGQGAHLTGSGSFKGARAKQLLIDYQSGKIDMSLVDKSIGDDAKAVTDLKKMLRDTKTLTDWLAGKGSENILAGAGSSKTGWFSKLASGAFGSDDRKKQDLLDQFKAETIKKYYGSAFTLTEMKNAGWIPGSMSSEFSNLKALQALQEQGISALRAAYKGKVSDTILEQIVKDALAETGLTAIKPSLEDIYNQQ